MTLTEPSVTVLNPLTRELVGEVPEHSAEQVATVVAGLRAQQAHWQGLGVAGRTRWLAKYRDWLLDNQERLAELLRSETGKPYAEALVELPFVIDELNYYGRHAAEFLADEQPRPHGLLTAGRRITVRHEAYPVVGVISPWNFPVALTLWDAIPALFAGSAVIVKPSEHTPLTVRAAVDGWRSIGAPQVFETVTGAGATGAAVVDTVDFLQFTGSVRTGRVIAEQAARRLIPVSLELGGKDPAIVLADADLERAAAGVAFGALVNSGQMCVSTERIYVEESVHDRFVELLVDQVSALRQNNFDGFDTELSGLITDEQFEIVQRHVEDALERGATVRHGGKPGMQPGFFEPTVLTDVDHSMLVMREETFGPVLPVMRARDADQAVELANDTEYGLAATVWAGSTARAQQIAHRLQVGAVDVNDSAAAHLICFVAPMSGWKSSGIGGRFGKEGIRKYCRTRTVVSSLPGTATMAQQSWFPYSAARSAFFGKFMRLTGGRDIRRRLGL
ncbi:aldehyde dehydrogenase family protein [Nocardia huaxiensis]|uniref:aldehyde dehydrogenase family protein n=1 Tax=Nocardia huaxiensis TaxID=2755382 RepID=UPI001E6386A1|nr:aldehyde dehydrogenase family protein [Nocardia huaxiensis]UFS98523.1 aldehyde dehydrogenase family protein [Nocardia huaxiensis]